ncbi:MAG TPA: PAS domain-containing protein [Methanoregulaceae archaeon]|nr:MAG: cyclic-di-GMP phosphodiesterase [Deltaproteobacteria bacterium ADurb.Bin135]HPA07674.1 PAS domain-containing protein [Methanoregulaceae archaeon]
MLETILKEITSHVHSHMGNMAKQLDVERVDIFQFLKKPDSDYPETMSCVFQWNKNHGIKKLKSAAIFRVGMLDKFILDKISKNVPVSGEVNNYKEFSQLFSINENNRINSFILTNIIIDDKIWGFVICLDKRKKLSLSADELIYLLDVSNKIASELRNKDILCELIKNNSAYHFFVDKVSDIVIHIDENYRIMSCGGYSVETMGYTEHDIVGKMFHELFWFETVDDRDRFTNDFQNFFSRRQNLVGHILLKTGAKLYVVCQSVPVFQDGLFKGAVCVITDIDEIKKNQHEVRDREEKLRILSENVSNACILWDKNYKPIYVSPQIFAETGFSSDEALDMLTDETSRGDFMFEKTFNLIMQHIEKVFETQRDHSFIAVNLRKKDGTEYIANMDFKLLRRKTGIYGVLTRIRNSVNGHYLLEDSHQRIINDLTQEIMFLTNEHARFTYWSPSVKPLLGYSIEEAMRIRGEELFESTSADRIDNALRNGQKSFRKKAKNWKRVMHINCIHKDGRKVKGRMTLTTTYNDQNEPIGFMGITSLTNK